MADPNRELMLKRRLRCEQTHLKYLQHISDDPSTVDAEIYRRYECIEDLKAQITAHMGRISTIMSTVQNVDQQIAHCKARLRSLKRELNKELIKQYLAEYMAINERLERDNDACSDTRD